MNTVVTIKAWKRPDYLKQCLESITTCYNWKKFNYVISVDNHEQTKNKMIDNIRSFKNAGAKIKLYYQKSKLGCAGNYYWVMDKGFEDTSIDTVIHIEEDNLVSKDSLLWLEWAIKSTQNDDNIFAACSFIRKSQIPWYKSVLNNRLSTNFYRKHFECGSAWAISRKIYNYIKSINGCFGAIGNTNTDLEPEQWRKSIYETMAGSWAWVANKYNRRHRYCIAPTYSRSANIGAKEGVFNPSSNWFQENIWNDEWIGNNKFKDQDLSNIKYILPTTDPI